MIIKGDRVKILDSYSGGLSDVKGKYARVDEVINNEEGTSYVLDHLANREGRYYKYPVIAKANEIEAVPFDIKDSEGNLIEIGDLVAFAAHGGYISKGVVVDFKDMVYPRWGQPYQQNKVKIEFDYTNWIHDGGDRSGHVPSKYSRWVVPNSNVLIVQKRALKYFLDKGIITFHGEETA